MGRFDKSADGEDNVVELGLRLRIPKGTRRLRLAIVGSVLLEGNSEAAKIIRKVLDRYQPTLVVSGKGRGIDTMAITMAQLKGIPTMEYAPEGEGWSFYKRRNLLIAQNCDRLVRIAARSSKTYGSGWTRDRARELGVPTEEYFV